MAGADDPLRQGAQGAAEGEQQGASGAVGPGGRENAFGCVSRQRERGVRRVAKTGDGPSVGWCDGVIAEPEGGQSLTRAPSILP